MITKLESSAGVVRVQATATLTTEAPRVSRIEKWQESKRIQTQSAVIAPEIKVIRSLDWDRDRFDMYVTCPTPVSLSLSFIPPFVNFYTCCCCSWTSTTLLPQNVH